VSPKKAEPKKAVPKKPVPKKAEPEKAVPPPPQNAKDTAADALKAVRVSAVPGDTAPAVVASDRLPLHRSPRVRGPERIALVGERADLGSLQEEPVDEEGGLFLDVLDRMDQTKDEVPAVESTLPEGVVCLIIPRGTSVSLSVEGNLTIRTGV